ncbi:hypothetical protein [Coraliomargarita sinensis]|nr:hypothetical protein [Coraliomargarita sinensis]
MLYPKPTKYQEASAVQMAKTHEEGGEEADAIRRMEGNGLKRKN